MEIDEDDSGGDGAMNVQCSALIVEFHYNYLGWCIFDEGPHDQPIHTKDVRFINIWVRRADNVLRTDVGSIRDPSEYSFHWTYILETELRGHLGSALQIKFKEEVNDIKNLKERYNQLIEEAGSIMVIVEKIPHSTYLTKMKFTSKDSQLHRTVLRLFSGGMVCIEYMRKREIITPPLFNYCR